MPTKEGMRYRSSSWWDVKVYCLEVGKAHNGYVLVHTSFNLPERVKKVAYWKVCFWPAGRSVEKGYTVAVGEYMPHTDYTSVTDLLMRLCYDLDAKLTQAERDMARQQSF